VRERERVRREREGVGGNRRGDEVSCTTEYKVSVAQFLLHSEFCADS